MPARLVALGCLVLFLAAVGGATAAPPQPLKGNPADRRAARRLIRLLLATDRAGNEHALDVSPTLAHRDHIHFGLSRAGAAKRTSFWRGR